jgi:predicted dithiol-disulfide oxidoreductase (DUF899 family)
MQLPPIVTEQEWQRSHQELLDQEKQATRARDALAAERRRQPMLELCSDHAFQGPDGVVTLPALFEGRSQLILYHFMFPRQGEPCGGCSMFTDQVCPLPHLHARDTSFALVSPASQAEIQPFKRRMGWEIPWYTPIGDEFQRVCGTSNGSFALDVFLRDGERVFLTYATSGRGVEALGSVWTFLDLTPFGRQEDWEDTPVGRPQGPRYEWWRLRDEYEERVAGGATAG